jgi:hypothetical protein
MGMRPEKSWFILIKLIKSLLPVIARGSSPVANSEIEYWIASLRLAMTKP